MSHDLTATHRSFLDRPGQAGPMGALMDLYAEAAESFCAVADTLPAGNFSVERPGAPRHTQSRRMVCVHVVKAARFYADTIRKARGLPHEERYQLPAGALQSPGETRALLAEALRYTEGALDGLYGAPEASIDAIAFDPGWGGTWNPDMLLEHAVCHLLRHRRQLQRWVD